MTAGQRQHQRAVAVDVEARGEAEVRGAIKGVLADLVAGRDGPVDPAVTISGGVLELAPVHPHREVERVQAARVVPVRVRQEHAAEPGAVVTAVVELLAHRPVALEGSAGEPRLHGDVRGDVRPEAGIDEEVAVRVPHEDGGGGELPLVTERATPNRECRSGLVGAGGELVDRHVGRRRRLGEGRCPPFGGREVLHHSIVWRQIV